MTHRLVDAPRAAHARRGDNCETDVGESDALDRVGRGAAEDGTVHGGARANVHEPYVADPSDDRGEGARHSAYPDGFLVSPPFHRIDGRGVDRDVPELDIRYVALVPVLNAERPVCSPKDLQALDQDMIHVRLSCRAELHSTAATARGVILHEDVPQIHRSFCAFQADGVIARLQD